MARPRAAASQGSPGNDATWPHRGGGQHSWPAGLANGAAAATGLSCSGAAAAGIRQGLASRRLAIRGLASRRLASRGRAPRRLASRWLPRRLFHWHAPLRRVLHRLRRRLGSLPEPLQATALLGKSAHELKRIKDSSQAEFEEAIKRSLAEDMGWLKKIC